MINKFSIKIKQNSNLKGLNDLNLLCENLKHLKSLINYQISKLVSIHFSFSFSLNSNENFQLKMEKKKKRNLTKCIVELS